MQGDSLRFGRLAPPRFCFGNSAKFTPSDNTYRSRAAQAAESEGGIITLSFGRLAPGLNQVVLCCTYAAFLFVTER